MPCFCSAPLGSLLDSLPRMPPLAGLFPPVSAHLTAAVLAPPGFTPLPMAAASASASANAAASANLAVMANLAADLKAALGINLMASLSGSAQASLQASLAATLGSLNAHGSLINPLRDLLERLLRELASLLNLAQLVGAARARFGIDLRAGGAVGALQARLTASASAAASARASAAASARLSASESLIASLGVQPTVAGVASLRASMQAVARLMASVPAVTVNLGTLSALAALLALLAVIKNALGVNLLAPDASASLRLALGGLPLAALATLQVQASATATASASATASATAAASAHSSLNLAPLARVNLAAAAAPSLALRASAIFPPLLLPAGSCGRPCPVAALQSLPPASAGITVSGASSARGW